MSKADTFKVVIKEFTAQTQRLTQAAQAAQAGATGDEVKAEGKYDTRGAEASYLAAAQAEQADAAQKALQSLGSYVPKDFDFEDTIALGALVETETQGEFSYYFLLPHAGGITVEHDGFQAHTLTPDAPLYQSLLGQKAGDTISDGETVILGVE